jgi:hypothetical protein
MPDVYIDSLTPENFGPYYGEHVFNFTPLDDRCGIVIGGKNGAGEKPSSEALYLAVGGESGVRNWRRVAVLATVA